MTDKKKIIILGADSADKETSTRVIDLIGDDQLTEHIENFPIAGTVTYKEDGLFHFESMKRLEELLHVPFIDDGKDVPNSYKHAQTCAVNRKKRKKKGGNRSKTHKKRKK